MNILAIDPSFQHDAYCFLCEDEMTVYFGMESFPLGEYLGFDRIFEAVRGLWQSFHESLTGMGIGNGLKYQIDIVASEIPPPTQAQFSSGLYALDTYQLAMLYDTYDSIKEILVIPPSYLATVHGTSRYSKSDSTKLAKYYINEVLKDDISVVVPDNVSASGRRTRGTINNDKAESFLFLLRAICRYDIKGLRNKIVCEMGGLGNESEKVLIRRQQKGGTTSGGKEGTGRGTGAGNERGGAVQKGTEALGIL